MAGHQPPRLPRSSQGTDMMEFLRFPDAIAFEEVIKNCNILARPLANRTLTNKCYILLWKATYFSSSVYIGVRHVQDTLKAMKEEQVPCLVIMAGDTFITDGMTDIISTCKSRDIPYIFIPNKGSMKDALSVDNDVIAVLIAFKDDPGMRREFEDCYVSMKSQCFKARKKRKVEHSCRASSTRTAPPEVGPRGEMPQRVTTQVSTEPSSVSISPRLEEPGTSSSADWITVDSDSDLSDDRSSSKDFSVNVPDESGSSFMEYVRIPSPTPAPSPSKMAAHQNLEDPVGDTTGACSSEESLVAGPSREFNVPASCTRAPHTVHRQSTWPIPLPYAPKEDFDDENVKIYLQTLCKKKKLRLRSKTSVPPMCCTPQSPLGQDYSQVVKHPQPFTTTQESVVSQSPEQVPSVDDSDDISFWYTMDDLSSTSDETIDRSTRRLSTDSRTLHAVCSTEEVEVMLDEPTPSMLQNEGASGDGNVCPMDTSQSSSPVSTQDILTGEQANSSERTSRALGDARFRGLNDLPPIPSFLGVTETSSAQSLLGLEYAPSNTSSGELSNVSSNPSSLLFGDEPSIPSSGGLGDSRSAQSFNATSEIPPFRGLGDALPDSSFHGLRDTPSCRGSIGIPPIPPFHGASSQTQFQRLSYTPSAAIVREIGEIPSIPPYRGPRADAQGEVCCIPSSGGSSLGLGDFQAGPSRRMGNVHASTSTSGGLGDAPPMPAPSSTAGDVPAVPSTSGEVGDAAVVPARPRDVNAAGEGSSQMSMTVPTAFGDAWPIGVRNPNVFRHRVTGTGEGHQPAFMPTNFSYVFAPRIVYTAASTEDGRRRMWNTPPDGMPREEDILAIPFPGEEDNRRVAEEDTYGNNNTSSRSSSMDFYESDTSSDESELSSDDSVDPPSPFEFNDQE